MLKNRLLLLFLLIICVFSLFVGCTININIGNSTEDATKETDSESISDYIFNSEEEPPMYESRATIYISYKTTTDTAISSSDLAISLSLVDTYAKILQSDRIQDKIRGAYPAVEYTLSLESIHETELFAIIATGENPEYLDEICNAAVSMLCEQLPQIVEGSSCMVVDYAKQPVQ